MLRIQQKSFKFDEQDYSSMSQQLNQVEWNAVEQLNWPQDYPYRPDTKFQIAHSNTHIVLHFSVKEDFVKAKYVRPNENVWEDSCVEFFLSLDNKAHYYNFEFNVLGTGLIGYGTSDKSSRQRLSDAQVLQIDTYTSVKNISGKKEWNIILVIPSSVLGFDENETLQGLTAYANFYKCGDELPEAHFVSWKPIDNPTPNFHLPAFFGKLYFE